MTMETTATTPSGKRLRRFVLGGLLGLVACAGALPAWAKLVPDPNQEPAPSSKRQAVGVDKDSNAAMKEAHAEAAATCVNGYDVLGVSVTIGPAGRYRYTLTYTCR